MIDYLNDKRLAELRQTLLGYAEYPGYTDAFRGKCSSCAALIEGFLDSRGSRDETASAIEALFGPLAMAELARAQQSSDAEGVVKQAYNVGDVQAWAMAMAKWLPLMSEEQHRGLMKLLHGHEVHETEEKQPVPSFVYLPPTVLQ